MLITLFYIIVGVLGIDVIIMVHELGHFAACRIFGVKVSSLNVGFGPAIFSKTKNGTTYRFCAIPVGGSTKMVGHEDIKRAIDKGEKRLENCEQGSIYSVSRLKRILIYLAGPLFNIFFAIICFTVFLCMSSVVSDSKAKIVLSADYPALYSNPCPAMEAGLKTGDTILNVNNIDVFTFSDLTKTLDSFKNTEDVRISTENRILTVHPKDGMYGILPFKDAVVGSVQRESAEYKAGLRPKDIILSANSQRVTNMFDIMNQAELSDVLTLTVLRSNKVRNITFNVNGDTLGFTLKGEGIRKSGEKFSSAFVKALLQCKAELVQFFDSIVMLLKGQLKFSQTIGGTIYASENIGMMTTKAFNASMNTGIRVVLYVIASVSMSLAAANFLPITALDGGLILITLIELITRRSFSPKTYVVLQVLGLFTLFIVIPVAKLFF